MSFEDEKPDNLQHIGEIIKLYIARLRVQNNMFDKLTGSMGADYIEQAYLDGYIKGLEEHK